MYSNPVARIKLNEAYNDWFDTTSGVKQCDSLSLTLFGIYINDLVAELNSYDLGVKLGDIKISLLLFTDDIVFITDSYFNLQKMLNVVNN